jgi:hypothetical protein
VIYNTLMSSHRCALSIFILSLLALLSVSTSSCIEGRYAIGQNSFAYSLDTYDVVDPNALSLVQMPGGKLSFNVYNPDTVCVPASPTHVAACGKNLQNLTVEFSTQGDKLIVDEWYNTRGAKASAILSNFNATGLYNGKRVDARQSYLLEVYSPSLGPEPVTQVEVASRVVGNFNKNGKFVGHVMGINTAYRCIMTPIVECQQPYQMVVTYGKLDASNNILVGMKAFSAANSTSYTPVAPYSVYGALDIDETKFKAFTGTIIDAISGYGGLHVSDAPMVGLFDTRADGSMVLDYGFSEEGAVMIVKADLYPMAS